MNQQNLIGKIGRKEGRDIQYEEVSSKSIGLRNFNQLDAFSKTGILLVLSGYRQCDYIVVNDVFSKKIKTNQLSKFLTYVINHPFSPKIFNLKISGLKSPRDPNFNFQVSNKYDSVLSFSGGIDSTSGLLNSLDRGQSIVPLWINFGQRNDRAELKSVKRVLSILQIEPYIVSMNINNYILEGWKDWNYIVPGRNFLFLSFANAILKRSSRSQANIYLCAHKDEMSHKRNTDKSRYFFKRTSQFFTQESNKEIIVNTPFPHVSKTEILSFWKRNWLKKYKISPHDTTTCYYGRGCGKCEVCLKRTVCLLASEFEVDPFIGYHPMKDPAGIIAKDWLPKIKAGKFTRIRKLDFIIATEKCIDIVPRYLRDFYLNLSRQTVASINKRKEEISKAEI